MIGWVIFLLLAYKVSKIQMEYVEYDPYMELEIERVGFIVILTVIEFRSLCIPFINFSRI